MSKERVCDVCNEPIRISRGITTGLYEQYKVTIKYIEEGYSFMGCFKKTEQLDICPDCMGRFADWLKKERGVIDD